MSLSPDLIKGITIIFTREFSFGVVPALSLFGRGRSVKKLENCILENSHFPWIILNTWIKMDKRG